MTTDKYQRDMHAALTLAYHNSDVKTALALIDRIYTDGFQDGTDNADALYKCKDDECNGVESRSAKIIQEAGDPYCPVCNGDMVAV